MRKLRGHHLICMLQFQGLGYNEEFAANMDCIIQELKENPSQQITVLKNMDHICGKCPNKLDEEHCALTRPGKPDSSVKDGRVLEVLGLDVGGTYCYQEILDRILDKVETVYDACCKGCGWEKQGVCSLNCLKHAAAQNCSRN
ncbi:MAG: DUF1284 domain-containing protein [bacterium]|nr:DUF1284 domain-containing protein [bacterium]